LLRLRGVCRLVTMGIMISAAALPAHAEKRLALVIGNDNYQNVQRLNNARADAKAIAAELAAVGFDVTLKLDQSEKSMKAALRDFKARVQGGDDVVFYFPATACSSAEPTT
jgi:uncharacterized caspase-like protein